MPKGKPKLGKMHITKMLRDLKKIGSEYGFQFAGKNGRGHYRFTNGQREIVTGSTPRDADITLKNFRRDCERA